MKRMFRKHPGQIRFTEDFHEETRGNLLPSQPIDLEYADSRISEEPSGAASIEAQIQFDGGPIVIVPLRLWQGWRDIDPSLTERGEGNLWVGTVIPPGYAKEMSIWFVKTGPSGRKYYDSSYGKNYWFRFTQNDVSVVHATVDENGFQVEVDAAPEVTAVEVRYTILNVNAATGVLSLGPTVVTREGRNRWAGSTKLDPRSVVQFVISYMVNGRTYTDDNDRRGYLAPDPEPILAAQRARQSETKQG